MDKRVVSNPELLTAALDGLQASPKRMDPKWFYDTGGSELFERITTLAEYYPTRTEIAILREKEVEIGRHVPDRAVLVELGSGASTKTRILLDVLPQIAAYVPIDVSEDYLTDVSGRLAEAYPDLSVIPLSGDFMADIDLPADTRRHPRVCFFPGSTIGNLEPDAAIDLLARVRQWPNMTAFIIGIDLVKDRSVLIRAYDDAEGVTAAFNRNLLYRLNRETGADFEPENFRHEARWNEDLARVEMHLVSSVPQTVNLGAARIGFERGDSIHTECSHKYTRQSFEALAMESGWGLADFLTDPDALFAVAVLEPG